MKLISTAAYALAAIAIISGQSEARLGAPSEVVGGRKAGWVFSGRGRGGPQGGFTAGRGYDLDEGVGKGVWGTIGGAIWDDVWNRPVGDGTCGPGNRC